jgi:hypothetical protein
MSGGTCPDIGISSTVGLDLLQAATTAFLIASVKALSVESVSLRDGNNVKPRMSRPGTPTAGHFHVCRLLSDTISKYLAGRLGARHILPPKDTGLKRTIVDYLRENFYGGILAGEYADQVPGAMRLGWP